MNGVASSTSILTLTKYFKAVMNFRKKMLNGEVTVSDNTMSVWEFYPELMKHTLDSFCTKLNQLNSKNNQNNGN